MDVASLQSELQRRGLAVAADGSLAKEELVERLRTVDELFTVREDADSFRAADITHSPVSSRSACWPEVYEDAEVLAQIRNQSSSS